MESVCYYTQPSELTPSEVNSAHDEEDLVQLALDTNTIADYSNHLISYNKLARILSTPISLNGNLHAHISAYMRQHLNSPFINEARNQIPAFRAAQASNLFKVSVLSTTSYEGITLSAQSPNNTPLFVIKTPKPGFSVTHEAVIGLTVANVMREETPCFMYTYTYSHCSAPRYVGEVVSTWCESEGPGFTVLEHIPGLSFEEAILYLSAEELEMVLAILVESLKLAYNRFRFIHGDLHAKNIIIRDLGEIVKLKVGEMIILTRYIPMIIDYGFASAFVGDRFMIAPIAAMLFSDPTLESPLYDLARILLALLPMDERRQIVQNDKYRVMENFYSITGRDYMQDASAWIPMLYQGKQREFMVWLYQELKGKYYPPTFPNDDPNPNQLFTSVYDPIDSCYFMFFNRGEADSVADLCDLESQGVAVDEATRRKATVETIRELM
jgi:hypothetical protein